MRKSLFTALVVAAGVASQAGAAWPPAYHITDASVTPARIPVSKLGLLTISLDNQFQLYTNWWGTSLYYGVNINPSRPQIPGVTAGTWIRPPGRTWENNSYDYLVNCMGTVKYASLIKKINNAAIISAINAAFTTYVPGTSTARGLFNSAPARIAGVLAPDYRGAFNPATAMLVMANYDNKQQAPAYPPTQDNFSPVVTATVWNAPYDLQNQPNVAPNGTQLQLLWPNQNYTAWGKLSPAADAIGGGWRNPVWLGARVFVLDPSNPNVNLRCFDVTPFFTFEESFCWFCWDTMGRVTDGTITKSSGVIDPPCATTLSPCGISGNGITRFYWTMKFNNANTLFTRNPNNLLDLYYKGPFYSPTILGPYSFTGIDSTSLYTYGADLDDTKADQAQQGLAFTVSGVASYTWRTQTLKDGFSWAMGDMGMWAYGSGYSPMCGVFSGSVGLVEYDSTGSGWGGAWTGCLP